MMDRTSSNSKLNSHECILIAFSQPLCMRLFRDTYRLQRLGLLWTPSLTPNRPASPSHGSPARLASGVFHVKLLAGPCGFSIDFYRVLWMTIFGYCPVIPQLVPMLQPRYYMDEHAESHTASVKKPRDSASIIIKLCT